MKFKNFSITVKSNEPEEAVFVSYDKSIIASNPFEQMDLEIDSIMLEIEGGTEKC